MMLKATDSEEEFSNFSKVDEIIDSLLTAHIASFDSSTSTLGYIFYCLAYHTETEEKCMEEIRAALKKSPTLDPDDLPYCNAVITETSRLYPAFVAISRTLNKPFKFANATAPAGTDVLIPFWFIQRDERYFPRALEFLPERWVKRSHDGSWVERISPKDASNAVDTEDDTSSVSKASYSSDDTTLPPGCPPEGKIKANRESYDSFDDDRIPVGNKEAFLTFSAGGRSCVGYKLARKQLCIILVELLRAFKFELVPGFLLNPRSIAVSQKHFGGMTEDTRQCNLGH